MMSQHEHKLEYLLKIRSKRLKQLAESGKRGDWRLSKEIQQDLMQLAKEIDIERKAVDSQKTNTTAQRMRDLQNQANEAMLRVAQKAIANQGSLAAHKRMWYLNDPGSVYGKSFTTASSSSGTTLGSLLAKCDICGNASPVSDTGYTNGLTHCAHSIACIAAAQEKVSPGISFTITGTAPTTDSNPIWFSTGSGS